ncbi:hypothetical protein TSAR_010396 [Trichomalopsis sarcophagae]|uniref:Cilia-and flagella-associated protein 96 n=1 Tax=Trichomalopsis sarcophagae TaxID=543379 RepID=A0A232ETH6_9HYME|nr:hypothetical protein TSAR_010396 [Trichomalopsis sarcophagae]
MAKNITALPAGEYGKHFGKQDLDRVGFFDDSPAGPFDEYAASRRTLQRDEGLAKGRRQILCKQPGDLFEREFKRVFSGEALPELGRQLHGTARGKRAKPQKLGVIKPPGAPKQHSTPGDWHGCLGKQPERFSPAVKLMVEERATSKPANFKTAPNPLGGPGYVDICLNPYLPLYNGYEPYDPDYERSPIGDGSRRRYVTTCAPQKYFEANPYKADPGRRSSSRSEPTSSTGIMKRFHVAFPGPAEGPNSGCFDRFPKYSSEPYRNESEIRKSKTSGNKWRPVGCDSRSKFTTSVIDRVTRVACNAVNFTDYRPQVKYEEHQKFRSKIYARVNYNLWYLNGGCH